MRSYYWVEFWRWWQVISTISHMHYDAFKCTVKELTTNSILNVRCLQSFGMCMPSCLLHPSLDLDQVDRFSFMVCCPCHEASFSHFQTPSPLQNWYFSVWQLPVCFPLFCGGSLLGCAVVPAMGRYSFYHLAAKSESPWILQAHNLHLAMQLLTKLFSILDIECIKWSPL